MSYWRRRRAAATTVFIETTKPDGTVEKREFPDSYEALQWLKDHGVKTTATDIHEYMDEIGATSKKVQA